MLDNLRSSLLCTSDDETNIRRICAPQISLSQKHQGICMRVRYGCGDLRQQGQERRIESQGSSGTTLPNILDTPRRRRPRP